MVEDIWAAQQFRDGQYFDDLQLFTLSAKEAQKTRRGSWHTPACCHDFISANQKRTALV